MRFEPMRLALGLLAAGGFSAVACGQSPYGLSEAMFQFGDDGGSGGGGGTGGSGGYNMWPDVEAGTDQTVLVGTIVTLSGTASDPDGDLLTYLWTQDWGTPVTLTAPTLLVTTFTAPDVEDTLDFTLEVSDGEWDEDDWVTVTVYNNAPAIDTITLAPDPALASDAITATVTTSDLDGHTVSVSYVWEVNSSEVFGETTNTLPVGNYVRNDYVEVIVTANDGYTNTVDTLGITLTDAPPVAAAGTVPATATYGALYSFDVTGTDPDGDTITYSLVYGPQGMTVDAGGNGTWTPGGPMFDDEMDVHFGVEAESGGLTDVYAGTVTVQDAGRERPLVRTGPRSIVRLVVGDLLNDGTEAIVAVAEGELLYTLTWDGAAYSQRWVYPFTLNSDPARYVSDVAIGDVNGDNLLEIFVAAANTLIRLDGATRKETATASDAHPQIIAVRAADLDGDGDVEVATLAMDAAESTLAIYDGGTLAELFRAAPADDHGLDLAIGNLDGDAALEIATAGGFVYDGVTYAIEWSYGGPFGDQVEIGDVDGDGTADLCGQDAASFKLYDFAGQTEAWTFSMGGGVRMRVREIDGDAGAEVLFGGLNISAFSDIGPPTHLVQDWQVAAPFFLTDIEVGDVDGDTDLEVVMGSDLLSADGSLTVLGPATAPVLEFEQVAPRRTFGPFVGAKWATFGVADERAVFAASAPSDDRHLVTMDATGAVVIGPQSIGSGYGAAVVVGDADGNGDDDIFHATGYAPGVFVGVYDDPVAASSWEITGYEPSLLVTYDLNRDGADDILFFDEDSSTLMAFDPVAQASLWQSASGDGADGDLEIGDLDGDGVEEIVLAGYGIVRVYARDTSQDPLVVFNEADSLYHGSAFRAQLAIGDIMGTTDGEIALAFAIGTNTDLLILDAGLNQLALTTLPYWIESLFIEPGIGPTRNLLVALDDDSHLLLAIDPNTGNEIWRSPPLLGEVQPNSLSALDLDGDTNAELLMGADAMILTR